MAAILSLTTGIVYLRGWTGTIPGGALTLTTPLAATSGGTGFAVYAIGDLLSADTTTTLSKVADVATGQVLVSGGVGVLPAWSASPTLTTSLTDPLVIGGTGATSTLTLRSTSGIGAAGADIIFQTGNNGGTEVARFLNNGNFGIAQSNPLSILDVAGTATGTYGISLAPNWTSAANFGAGIELRPTVNLTGTGTNAAVQVDAIINLTGPGVTNHTLVAQNAYLVETIVQNDDTITNAATVYIQGAQTATVTGATYALWSAGGLNRFDGTVQLGTATTVAGLLSIGKGVGGGNLWSLASAATSAWTMTGAAVAPAQGDLLVFSNATGQMASVVDVVAGSYLRSGGANLVPVYSTVTLPNTAATGNILIASATNVISAATPASANIQPANQTGNATGTLKMNGLGAAAAPTLLTPVTSGRVAVTISGDLTNSVVLDGVQYILVYGSGAPPANAAVASGTVLSATRSVAVAVAAQNQGFSVSATVTGLTISTAYWFDLQISNVTGGTASMSNITFAANEF